MKTAILLISCLLGPGLLIQGAELDGPGVMREVNRLFNPPTSFSHSTMTVYTSSGKKRTFELKSWNKNLGGKTLVRYLQPRRVRGQATLMLNHADDIWMFFPRTQRVRKLATHAKKQKMQGSDFSYEDLGSGDAFVSDYSARRLQDCEIKEVSCYLLELVRKPDSSMSYSRLLMKVRKKDFVPLEIEYFHDKRADHRMKVLRRTDIRTVDGIPTPFHSEMFNENDSTRTTIDIIDIRFGLKIEDAMFTERELKNENQRFAGLFVNCITG